MLATVSIEQARLTMSTLHKRCRNCLLPANAPGAEMDEQGTCKYCREYNPGTLEQAAGARREREADLECTLEDCRGRAEYDAVVCLSGGKDSIWLLYRLVVDYKLRVLAFTTDVNIPEIAWKNIRRTVAKLNVDHLIYRPDEDFYRRLFRYLLTHQEARGAVYTVSYVYAPLFEGDALKVAAEKGIPLVLAGYSPGQPEPERMLYEFSRPLIENTNWTPPHLRDCGEFDAQELARFWSPNEYPSASPLPRYLAPFHAWEYDQEAVMGNVVGLGLVANSRHASPIFSNYPINWLLMYSDLRHFGYNPYAPEFSALMREGKANRTYWRVMAPIVDTMIRNRIVLGREVKRSMNWLELNDEDLRITEPHGAYDPPVGAA